jgi:histidinol dehydrogenase
MLKIYTDLNDAQAAILNRRKAEMPLPDSLKQSLRRIFERDLTPAEAVAEILADVRDRGDAALHDWTARIDGVTFDRLAIERSEIAAAPIGFPELIDHCASPRPHSPVSRASTIARTTNDLGGTLGQKMTPLDRVGVYVPGGTAPLPSTLLMSAIPAQVAGVKDLIVVTPPGRNTGAVSDVILAAAHVAGIDTIYRLGGAQAIGALAYGTERSRVDKIVGPGNLFVTPPSSKSLASSASTVLRSYRNCGRG